MAIASIETERELATIGALAELTSRGSGTGKGAVGVGGAQTLEADFTFARYERGVRVANRTELTHWADPVGRAIAKGEALGRAVGIGEETHLVVITTIAA